MPGDIPLKISQGDTLDGAHPVVIIGPNGSGKTRFGVELIGLNNAEMIGAVRNLQLQTNLPMQALTRANQVLTDQINRRRSAHWETANEIDQLFSKLLAADSASAVRFRDSFINDKNAVPQTTALQRLISLWEELFPGRRIDFASYAPKVFSKLGGVESEYTADRMSDGERVAIYLIGRIVNAPPGVIVVDEPEVHFHSRLATDFWNALEGMRKDIRFVYITHDIPFALSRGNAQFVVVRENAQPELLPLEEGLPHSVLRSILGAASFSIYARRIVFCEGEDGPVGDKALYAAWFKDPQTAVVPVGSATDVVRCAVAFGHDKLVHGASAIGIIDRDYWPDAYLNALPTNVSALCVHELENLFCLQDVYFAVGRHLGIHDADLRKRHDTFISRAKANFVGELLGFRQRISGSDVKPIFNIA